MTSASLQRSEHMRQEFFGIWYATIQIVKLSAVVKHKTAHLLDTVAFGMPKTFANYLL
jgi:hypothetical protein